MALSDYGASPFGHAIAADSQHDARKISYAADRRRRAGDNAGARALYARAAALAPDDPAILTAAGDTMRYTGELSEAVVLFDRALVTDPAAVAAWYGRGLALEALGVLEEAKASYRKVTQLAPMTAPGFAALASAQSLLGEIDAAEENARRALAIAPGDTTTIITLARCDIAGGRHNKAAVRLRELLRGHGLALEDRVRALGMLGDALDGLGRVNDAFDAYARANSRFAEMHAGINAPPLATRQIEAIDAAVAGLAWRNIAPASAVDGEATNHIFLLGYPRSGTTLVEQVLATVPGVVALEEAPTLAAGEWYLRAEGIGRLMAMSDDEAGRLRADYWARVAQAGVDVAGRTFVDMDPFKTPALPLIARLFPRAKVVMVRRDPRDVVWSCFRRNFVYTPTALEFTSLHRAARHYAAVMALSRRCFATLQLNAFQLQYEELVGDFDSTTQRLCDFAGLAWSTGLRDFPATARARPVKTASVAQVRRPLFDGSGQWRRYALQLEPVLPLLAPWVSTGFGISR